MKKDDMMLLQSHLSKMRYAFRVMLAVITLIELILLIRGFAVFNLEKQKLRLYLYSYIFLFVASLAMLIVDLFCAGREKRVKLLLSSTYLYAFCFILWSAVVTCIDCYANGDSGMMVYIMTCVAAGVLTLIKPWAYIACVGISGAIVLVFTAYIRNWTPYSSGFYLNFAIFFATAVFVNAHNYSLSRREYLARQSLRKLSYTDQLTGIYNRRRLDKNITAQIEQAQPFSFVLLDIDMFKQINDTYGHPMGDNCLVKLAEILTARFGEHVYRFGGDEFAIISHADANETGKAIDSINRELETAFDDLIMHISAGVCTATAADTLAMVFAKADRALYRSKQTGRARWTLYQEAE